LVDRDINAVINVLKVVLYVFPTLKRRKGGVKIVASITDFTKKLGLKLLTKAPGPSSTGFLNSVSVVNLFIPNMAV
jgi:hypothetical protein